MKCKLLMLLAGVAIGDKQSVRCLRFEIEGCHQNFLGLFASVYRRLRRGYQACLFTRMRISFNYIREEINLGNNCDHFLYEIEDGILRFRHTEEENGNHYVCLRRLSECFLLPMTLGIELSRNWMESSWRQQLERGFHSHHFFLSKETEEKRERKTIQFQPWNEWIPVSSLNAISRQTIAQIKTKKSSEKFTKLTSWKLLLFAVLCASCACQLINQESELGERDGPAVRSFQEFVWKDFRQRNSVPKFWHVGKRSAVRWRLWTSKKVSVGVFSFLFAWKQSERELMHEAATESTEMIKADYASLERWTRAERFGIQEAWPSRICNLDCDITTRLPRVSSRQDELRKMNGNCKCLIKATALL